MTRPERRAARRAFVRYFVTTLVILGLFVWAIIEAFPG